MWVMLIKGCGLYMNPDSDSWRLIVGLVELKSKPSRLFHALSRDLIFPSPTSLMS